MSRKRGRMAATVRWMTNDNPGLGAVTGTVICQHLEERKLWLVLLFAIVCALCSLLIFLLLGSAWILGVIPGLWAIVACRHWWLASRKVANKQGSGERR